MLKVGNKVSWRASGKGARAYNYNGQIITGTISEIDGDDVHIVYSPADKKRYKIPFDGAICSPRQLKLILQGKSI